MLDLGSNPAITAERPWDTGLRFLVCEQGLEEMRERVETVLQSPARAFLSPPAGGSGAGVGRASLTQEGACLEQTHGSVVTSGVSQLQGSLAFPSLLWAAWNRLGSGKVAVSLFKVKLWV